MMYYLAQIASLENLRSAFRHVATNHGAPGVDNVTLESFSEHLEHNLACISQLLATNSYQLQPALAAELYSQERTIYILAVADRVVFQAIKQVLDGELQPFFHEACYSYRPSRSAVQAAKKLQHELEQVPTTYVLRCDIEKYFDTIDQQILCRMLAQILDKEATQTMQLIRQVLEQPRLINGELLPTTTGICQGSPLSPLLSNLYLSPFDYYIQQKDIRHFRFCDDIAILLKNEQHGHEILRELTVFLQQHLGLKFHPEKQNLESFQTGFEFLGFHFSPAGRFPGKAARLRLKQRLATTEDADEKQQAIQRWEVYYGSGTAEIAQGKLHHEQAKDDTTQPQATTITQLFLELFQGNSHCFAQAYKTPRRYGYSPVKRALNEQDIEKHIRGEQTLGLYLLRDDKIICTCLDLDLAKQIMDTCYHNDPGEFSVYQDRILQYARTIQKLLKRLELTALLENSGYKGYHLWLFLEEFMPAATLIKFWRNILQHVGSAPKGIQREIFPREHSARGRLGSLIKIPLAIHPLSGCRSMFVDDNGEFISNPLQLLAQVPKAGSSIIENIAKEGVQVKSDSIQRLLDGCNVANYLCQKSYREKNLGHFERLILLYTLGQLSEDGVTYLHQIIGHCRNYNRHYTQRQIDRKHPSPIGCRKIQEIMGDVLNNIECSCVFELPQGGYASPLLHVYPQGTRNLGRRKRKSR